MLPLYFSLNFFGRPKLVNEKFTFKPIDIRARLCYNYIIKKGRLLV